MSFSEDEFNKLLDTFMKQINQMGKDFGFGTDAFDSTDKELVRDTIYSNAELFELARSLHQSMVNQAAHTISFLAHNKPGGIERLQQFLIVYYRIRDSFLQDLLGIENEFYKYTVSKIVNIAGNNSNAKGNSEKI